MKKGLESTFNRAVNKKGRTFRGEMLCKLNREGNKKSIKYEM